MSDLPAGNGTTEVLAWAYKTTGDHEFEWARLEVTSVYQPWKRNSDSPDRIAQALEGARKLLHAQRRNSSADAADG